MSEPDQNPKADGWRRRILRFLLTILAIIAFAVFAITLENEAGIPFKTTFRIACIGGCLWFLWLLKQDYPTQRWPWIALWLSLIVDIGLLFTPIRRLPASKGDLLFFALPDATIALAASITFYKVGDIHQRAVRQQLIMALIISIILSAIVLSIMFIPPSSIRR